MDNSTDPDHSAPVTPAETDPIPVRYWWLKRILITSGVLIVGLVLVRIWWGCEAHRQLEAQIAEYVAAGEPIYPEDFDQDPVPDHENAAKMYNDAATAFKLTTDDEKLIDTILDDFSSSKQHVPELQRLVEKNAETLHLIHSARDAPGIDWGIRFRTPVLTTFQNVFPMLPELRQLSKALSVVTAYYHAIGDHEAAVNTLRDAFAHADAFKSRPFLVSHLMGIAIYHLHAQSVERLAPTLQIADARFVAREGSKSATRAQVTALISDLLDNHAIEEGLAQAMLGERMYQLDFGRTMRQVSGTLLGVTGPRLWISKVIAFPLTPLLDLDTLHMLQYSTGVARVAGELYPQALPAAASPAPANTALDQIVHALSRITLPSLERTLPMTYRACAMRQMAGLALAIRLYELDNGKRPKRLSELVPNYIAAVPIDPFAADGRKISYLPEADPPILYCIGENMVDDAGEYEVVGDRIYRHKLDYPFFLDGEIPTENTSEDDPREQP